MYPHGRRPEPPLRITPEFWPRTRLLHLDLTFACQIDIPCRNLAVNEDYSVEKQQRESSGWVWRNKPISFLFPCENTIKTFESRTAMSNYRLYQQRATKLMSKWSYKSSCLQCLSFTGLNTGFIALYNIFALSYQLYSFLMIYRLWILGGKSSKNPRASKYVQLQRKILQSLVTVTHSSRCKQDPPTNIPGYSSRCSFQNEFQIWIYRTCWINSYDMCQWTFGQTT